MPETVHESLMRVLWTHNFDPAKANSQVFMNIAAEGIRRRGAELHCEYLGNLRSVKNLVAAGERIRKMAFEFDVVHAQYGSACGLATSAVDTIPKVLSIRGNDWSVHNASFGFDYVHTRLARWMTKRALPRYDAVITVSNRVAREVQTYSGQREVVALPSPIDLTRFVPLDKESARRQLGLPDAKQERWVLFNALNLRDPIKRFDLAQRAFDLANAKCGNLRLRVASDLPHCDIPLFTAACDVILCTSETEGWPNSVKEALACNVPFVATDVSDLRSIANVEPSCRVSSDDPVALSEALCEVLANSKRADLRKHVATMNVGDSSARLLTIYESLLRAKPKMRTRVRN